MVSLSQLGVRSPAGSELAMGVLLSITPVREEPRHGYQSARRREAESGRWIASRRERRTMGRNYGVGTNERTQEGASCSQAIVGTRFHRRVGVQLRSPG